MSESQWYLHYMLTMVNTISVPEINDELLMMTTQSHSYSLKNHTVNMIKTLSGKWVNFSLLRKSSVFLSVRECGLIILQHCNKFLQGFSIIWPGLKIVLMSSCLPLLHEDLNNFYSVKKDCQKGNRQRWCCQIIHHTNQQYWFSFCC